MILEQLKLGPLDNFVYLIGDPVTATGAVVDPGWDMDLVLRTAEQRGFAITHALITHSHPDHIQGIGDLVRRVGARVAMHKVAPLGKDDGVDEGDVLPVGSLQVRVLHTPGHLTDSVCYLVDGHLFTGDTLFVGECGRTDFAGGSSEQLYDSLMRLRELPPETVVCSGHDYGATPLSTIAAESAGNYTMRDRTRGEFVQFMREP